MPTITTLATGLAGAIGSHYHGSSNRLYFVEYGGKLSRYDFVRAPDVVLLNNVARTLTGTWLMNPTLARSARQAVTSGGSRSTPCSDAWCRKTARKSPSSA